MKLKLTHEAKNNKSYTFAQLKDNNIEFIPGDIGTDFHNPSQEIQLWLNIHNINYMTESPWPNYCAIFMFDMNEELRLQFKLTFDTNIESHTAPRTLQNLFGLLK